MSLRRRIHHLALVNGPEEETQKVASHRRRSSKDKTKRGRSENRAAGDTVEDKHASSPEESVVEQEPAAKRVKTLEEFHEYLQSSKKEDEKWDWDGESPVKKPDMLLEHENVGLECGRQIGNYCKREEDDKRYGHPGSGGGVDITGDRKKNNRGGRETFSRHRHPDAQYRPLNRSNTNKKHLPTLVVEVCWTQRLVDARHKVAREWFREEYDGQRVEAALIILLRHNDDTKRLDAWLYRRTDNNDVLKEQELTHLQHVSATTAGEAAQTTITL